MALKWLSNNNGRTYEVWEMAANGEEAIRLVAEFERADEADHYVVTVNDRVEWIKHYKDDVETRVAAVKGRAEEVCRLWDRTAQRAAQWARAWKAAATEHRRTVEVWRQWADDKRMDLEERYGDRCDSLEYERDAARAEAEALRRERDDLRTEEQRWAERCDFWSAQASEKHIEMVEFYEPPSRRPGPRSGAGGGARRVGAVCSASAARHGLQPLRSVLTEDAGGDATDSRRPPRPGGAMSEPCELCDYAATDTCDLHRRRAALEAENARLREALEVAASCPAVCGECYRVADAALDSRNIAPNATSLEATPPNATNLEATPRPILPATPAPMREVSDAFWVEQDRLLWMLEDARAAGARWMREQAAKVALATAGRWENGEADPRHVVECVAEEIEALPDLPPRAETTTKPSDNRSDRQTDVRLANGSTIRVGAVPEDERLRGRWEPCACNDPDCELCQSRWVAVDPGGEG